MKKRTLATILTAALLGCSLCACGSAGGSSATTAAAAAAPAAEGQAEGGSAADLPKMTLSIGHNNNSDSLMNYVAEQMKA